MIALKTALIIMKISNDRGASACRYTSALFEHRRQAFAHGCNPTMDRDQREKDVEQKDLYGKDGNNHSTHFVRSGARLDEECLINFAEEVNNQQS